MEVMGRLNEVFREVFDDDDIVLTSEMTANDIDGWDSLSHVNLILTIEATFNIRFTRTELMKLKNVGDLQSVIAAKLPV